MKTKIKTMKKGIFCLTLAALLCGCASHSTVEIDNFILVKQKKGADLGYSPASGVKLIEADGLLFKDHNQNDSLDAYEDWRLPAAERAADLAKDLSLDEIAGLMLYSRHMAIPHISTTNPKRYTYSGKPWLETDAPLPKKPPDFLRSSRRSRRSRQHIERTSLGSISELM